MNYAKKNNRITRGFQRISSIMICDMVWINKNFDRKIDANGKGPNIRDKLKKALIWNLDVIESNGFFIYSSIPDASFSLIFHNNNRSAGEQEAQHQTMSRLKSDADVEQWPQQDPTKFPAIASCIHHEQFAIIYFVQWVLFDRLSKVLPEDFWERQQGTL